MFTIEQISKLIALLNELDSLSIDDIVVQHYINVLDNSIQTIPLKDLYGPDIGDELKWRAKRGKRKRFDKSLPTPKDGYEA